MSLSNDKALKSVAEAVNKIMEAEKKAKMDYDKDGKVESPKDEVWGSRLRAAKMAGKLKEEEELDETTRLVGRSSYKTKEDAVKYAKEKVKTHRDNLEGIEIHAHKDRKSTRLNSSHIPLSRMPSSA